MRGWRLLPQPHVLDSRGLAALRVVLGLFVLQVKFTGLTQNSQVHPAV
jgi:hypothetical protein